MRLKLLLLLFSIPFLSSAQQRISILGDSYSIYQGYITPQSNEMWHFEPWIDSRTDVNYVKQTWWYQVCKAGDYKLEMNKRLVGKLFITYVCFSLVRIIE